MSAPPMVEIHIPDDDELGRNLSVSFELEDRIRYVRMLLVPARDAKRVIERMREQLDREQERHEKMGEELRALRQKVGELPPGERAAADQRYDMIGKMRRANNALDRFERDSREAVREMREALKR